ncbi:MAG: DUF4143 domain-containing protein [Lentisphaerales bacterium]|nr:DUF4143 domain-containing protein [Lentisphaerales bacterium]
MHYWVREKSGSAAEIDYVIELKGRVIPVEVKAGKSGRLRSLQQFAKEKKCSVVLRFNDDLSFILTIDQNDSSFQLISLPYTWLEKFRVCLTTTHFKVMSESVNI